MKKIFVKIISLILCASLAISVIGCDKKAPKEIVSTDYSYFYPQEAEGHLSNPGNGWSAIEEVIYYGQPELGGSGVLPEVDVISIESSWAFLEPEKDVFDFSLIDKTMEYWKRYNKKFIFRIMTDGLTLGFTQQGCPMWLLQDSRCGYKTLTLENHLDNPTSYYTVANVSSDYYQERLKIFLNALSEHFGNDKDLEMIEIRGYGNWGEWHSGYGFDTMTDRINVLTKIIDQYKDAWRKYGKQLVVSNSYDPQLLNSYNDNYEAYYSASALDYIAQNEGLSYRRDAVGSSVFKDQYCGRLISDVVRSGKQSPLYAEFYWYAKDMAAASEEAWNFENAVNHMLFKGRPNVCSVIGYNPYAVADMVDSGQTWAFDRGNEKLGYRLVVNQARVNSKVNAGENLSIMMQISNKGVGRFFFEDNIKYYITDKDGNVVCEKVDTKNNLRNLMLGDVNEYYCDINLPKNLHAGEYSVSVAVVDETGEPHIRLAIDGDQNKKIYKIATFNVVEESVLTPEIEKKLSYSELEKTTLDSNSVYTLTFGYTPGFDMGDFQLGNYDGYSVRLKSSTGKTNMRLLKWQDISGNYGTKTITFATGSDEGYFVTIGSENFGNISVENVYLRKETATVADFDSNNKNAFELNGDLVKISREDGKIHNGTLFISSNDMGDSNCTSSKKISLLPNTTYTLSFNAQTITDVGIGGYFYVALKNETSENGDNILEWYERPDTPYSYKSVTFTTDSSKSNEIIFGVHNRGEYSVDDVIITQTVKGSKGVEKNYGFTHNQRPEFEDKTEELEDFEGISFYNSKMWWGYFRWGRITTDPDLVISGKQSWWGVMDKQKLSEWMELMYSNSRFVKFDKNSEYTIEFDYKVLKNPVDYDTNEKGFFYLLLRSISASQNGSPDSDIGFNTFTDTDLNQVKRYKVNIKTGDYEDYRFIFGMKYYGEIIIDNLKITKV